MATTYLVDCLARLAATHTLTYGTRESLQIGADYEPVNYNFNVTFAKDVIENYELFSFERSSLYAAADLNTVGNETNFAKIASIIFAEKRKFFVEFDYAERKKAFSQLYERDKYAETKHLKDDPVRCAFIVDSHGDGTGEVRLCWVSKKTGMLDAGEGRSLSFRDLTNILMKSVNADKSEKAFIENVLAVNFSVLTLDINTNLSDDTLSFDDWQKEREDATTEAAALYAAFYIHSATGFDGSQDEKAAYEHYVLNRIVEIGKSTKGEPQAEYMMQSNFGGSPAVARDAFIQDVNGETHYIIPILGLLLSGGLSKTYRQSRKVPMKKNTSGKLKKKNIGHLVEEPLINVLSLELAPELQKAIEYREPTSSGDPNTQKRKSPVYHLVRGHAFVRNGKIGYKAPYFRGVINNKPTLVTVKS